MTRLTQLGSQLDDQKTAPNSVRRQRFALLEYAARALLTQAFRIAVEVGLQAALTAPTGARASSYDEVCIAGGRARIASSCAISTII